MALTDNPAPAPPRLPVWSSHVVKVVVATGVGVGILALVLPQVAGVAWGDIGRALAALTTLELVFLAALWWAGLCANTLASSAALPGLSRRRALLLNVSGSFVSNLFPLGGAAGTVANYTMSRSWGFSAGAFVRWSVVTSIWDTVLKLALPTAALVWLAGSGLGSWGTVGTWLAWGLALLAACLTGVIGLLGGERSARVVGGAADAATGLVRWLPRPDGGYAARAAEFRRESSALIAARWPHLTAGKVAYALLQALLLWVSLRAVGASPAPAVVFAAFSAERILSLVALTPGATGVTEVGMAGLLVAFGTEPAAAAAGVLVYRAFTFGAEIPVGGLGLLWWAVRRPRTGVALARQAA